jgi:hypothetical protein
MELTILLSKVFGIYFLVMGIIVLFRRGFFKSLVNVIVEEPALRFTMGVIGFIGGLFMIVSHQDWSNFAAGVISALGWIIAVKSLLYMNLSNSGVRKWVGWYKLGGAHGFVIALIYIALGLYLSNFAMGWF